MPLYNQHDIELKDAVLLKDEDNNHLGFTLGQFRFDKTWNGVDVFLAIEERKLLSLYDDDDIPHRYVLSEPPDAIVIHQPYHEDGSRAGNMVVGTLA